MLAHVASVGSHEKQADGNAGLCFHRWPFTTGTCPRHSRMLGAGRTRRSYSGLRSMQTCCSRGWGTRWSFGSHWTSPMSLLTRATATGRQLQVKISDPTGQQPEGGFLSTTDMKSRWPWRRWPGKPQGLRIPASPPLRSDTTSAERESHVSNCQVASLLCASDLPLIRSSPRSRVRTNWYRKGQYIRLYRSTVGLFFLSTPERPKFPVFDLADLGLTCYEPV